MGSAQRRAERKRTSKKRNKCNKPFIPWVSIPFWRDNGVVWVDSILTILMDISEFGLKAETPTGRSIAQVGPRFYMKYLNQVWFLLFAPGKRDCIMGYSDDIIRKKEVDDNHDRYSKMAADEAVMAQEFDVKLEQEVSRGMGRLVGITKKLSGWHASTLQFSLESSQYTDAILTLPGSHPAHMDLVQNLFRRR